MIPKQSGISECANVALEDRATRFGQSRGRAASFGADTIKLLAPPVSDPDDIRLQARLAFHFAIRARREESEAVS